ncbi:MAG TPA: DNA repair protein RecO, partial [Devosia sp.]|nr:DNA repair protein RecO [Devosia sp.]
TGENEGLSHVSPRTGRAVTRRAAGKYVDRLLELPAFFRQPGTATPAQVAAGLKLTGHFLDRHIWSLRTSSAPPERERLLGELGSNSP